MLKKLLKCSILCCSSGDFSVQAQASTLSNLRRIGVKNDSHFKEGIQRIEFLSLENEDKAETL